MLIGQWQISPALGPTVRARSWRLSNRLIPYRAKLKCLAHAVLRRFDKYPTIDLADCHT